MQELSNILHSATADSLVILDEVGRGTATYDGISIAWAATEYLHNEVRARTLFATHYHELTTTLADHLPRVANVHVAVDERDGEVTFLRTVRDGPTNRSYGVHVADPRAFRLRSSPAPGRCSTGSARRRRSRRRAERGAEGANAETPPAPPTATRNRSFSTSRPGRSRTAMTPGRQRLPPRRRRRSKRDAAGVGSRRCQRDYPDRRGRGGRGDRPARSRDPRRDRGTDRRRRRGDRAGGVAVTGSRVARATR